MIGIKTDVSKIMNGETNVSMAKNPVVMGGPYSAKITENYKTMFSFAGFKKELTAQPNTKVALGMN